MKLQFGMYWNNNKQPHCIKCKTPLIQPAKVQFEDLFKIKGVTPVPKQYCITCDKYFSIVDVNRSELTLEEAQAKVKTV